MKIAEGLEMLELTYDVRGTKLAIHPMVVHDADTCVLVDTGMPGSYEPIMQLIAQAGIRAAGLHLQALPKKQRAEFERTFSKAAGANVTHVAADGDVLPFGGGLRVIHTPGHTPGHICLYHEASQTLIAGDAMIIENGELQGPRAQVTPDMDAAIRSLKKLMDFPIKTVICYHGGVFKGDVGQRLEEITASVK